MSAFRLVSLSLFRCGLLSRLRPIGRRARVTPRTCSTYNYRTHAHVVSSIALAARRRSRYCSPAVAPEPAASAAPRSYHALAPSLPCAYASSAPYPCTSAPPAPPPTAPPRAPRSSRRSSPASLPPTALAAPRLSARSATSAPPSRPPRTPATPRSPRTPSRARR